MALYLMPGLPGLGVMREWKGQLSIQPEKGDLPTRGTRGGIRRSI